MSFLNFYVVLKSMRKIMFKEFHDHKEKEGKKSHFGLASVLHNINH